MDQRRASVISFEYLPECLLDVVESSPDKNRLWSSASVDVRSMVKADYVMVECRLRHKAYKIESHCRRREDLRQKPISRLKQE